MSLSCEAGADIEYYSQDTMQNISAQSPALRLVQGTLRSCVIQGKLRSCYRGGGVFQYIVRRDYMRRRSEALFYDFEVTDGATFCN